MIRFESPNELLLRFNTLYCFQSLRICKIRYLWTTMRNKIKNSHALENERIMSILLNFMTIVLIEDDVFQNEHFSCSEIVKEKNANEGWVILLSCLRGQGTFSIRLIVIFRLKWMDLEMVNIFIKYHRRTTYLISM